MKLKTEKKTVSKIESKLAEMDRDELKAFNKSEELNVKVFKSDDEDDLRKKIMEALEESGEEESDEAEQEDDSEEEDDGTADDSEEDSAEDGESDTTDDDDSEESKEEETADEDEVDLDELDRKGLKAFIDENELDVQVKKSDDEDDIRKKIAAAVTAIEEEVEEKKSSKKESKSNLDWMYKGKDVDREMETAAANMQKQFSPEFFVKDGASAIIRLRDDDPICGLYMYSVNDGKRWKAITQPADPADDKFMAAGKRPMFRLIYEVIDRTGYTNKQGKKVKDVPKFWLVNDSLHKLLQRYRTKKGSLTKFDIEITREGKKKPLYQLDVDDSLGKMRDEVKALPRLSKDIAKYYAPPTVEEQKRLLRSDEEAVQSED